VVFWIAFCAIGALASGEEAVNLGSNPSPRAMENGQPQRWPFFYCEKMSSDGLTEPDFSA